MPFEELWRGDSLEACQERGIVSVSPFYLDVSQIKCYLFFAIITLTVLIDAIIKIDCDHLGGKGSLPRSDRGTPPVWGATDSDADIADTDIVYWLCGCLSDSDDVARLTSTTWWFASQSGRASTSSTRLLELGRPTGLSIESIINCHCEDNPQNWRLHGHIADLVVPSKTKMVELLHMCSYPRRSLPPLSLFILIATLLPSWTSSILSSWSSQSHDKGGNLEAQLQPHLGEGGQVNNWSLCPRP